MDSQDDDIEITAIRLKERLDGGERPQLIDVREPWEWDSGNLSDYGARLIPMATIPERLGELDPGEEIVVYCRSGARSMRVLQYMHARGFERVRNLRGGLHAWSNEVDPSFPQY